MLGGSNETEQLVLAEAAALADLKERLVAEARALGFATVGFASAADDPVRSARLREWLAEGAHGEMGWMEDRAEVRQGPQSMWAEARSVIALGMSYAPGVDPLALEGDPERAFLGLVIVLAVIGSLLLLVLTLDGKGARPPAPPPPSSNCPYCGRFDHGGEFCPYCGGRLR